MSAIVTSCIEGMQYIGVHGMPATLDFTLVEELLAADPDNPGVDELSAVSEFADLTEATWSGYARINKAVPAPVDGGWAIVTDIEFDTLAATNGPAEISTLAVLIPGTHELVGLWDAAYYLNSGVPMDMSSPGSLIRVTHPIELFLSTLTAVA